MIKNERQYRLTRAQARHFAVALAQLSQVASNDEQDSLKATLQEAALRSQLQDLEAQLGEYDRLRSHRGILTLDSFADLPRAFIRARIASGLSQAQLAERLHLKEQQIQRYEATDYAGVSLERAKDIVEALGIEVGTELFLPAPKASVGAIYKRFRLAGLARAFIDSRLLPHSLIEALQSRPRDRGEEEILALQLAAAVGRIFNWTTAMVLGDAPLTLGSAVLSTARFKRPARINEQTASAYTVYAHYLALLVAQSTDALPKRAIPTSATSVRQQILKRYGIFSLQAVLRYAWHLGVPILPLRDVGAFHGACWRVDGRNVLVLKQTTASQARWIIDTLHELFHAAQNPDASEFVHLDAEDILRSSASSQETIATDFAMAVALGNRAEALIQRCVEAAKGKVEWLKNALIEVASSESVDAGVLANYLAHRLSSQDINWWATAAALQPPGDNPWLLARTLFLEHVDLGSLNDLDRDLLIRALTVEEHFDPKRG